MQEDRIRMLIRKLAGGGGGLLTEGEVTGVDWDERTCRVRLWDGRELPAVRLKAVSNGSAEGLCLRPRVGSKVLVACVGDETEQAVVLCEAVTCVALEMEGLKLTAEGGVVRLEAERLEVEAEETVWNGGAHGGLVVAAKVAARLNELEAALAELKTVYGAHVHTVTGASTGPATPPLTYSVPQSAGSDFENDAIKH